MSKKIGIPIRKGMASGKFSRGDAHINVGAAAREALADETTGVRSCSDVDYSPYLTSANTYLTHVHSYQDSVKEREKHIEAYYAQGGRKIRSDSPVGVVGIIKPDIEVMSHLTPQEQIRLLERALDKTLSKFNMTRDNLIYAVIHVDEGNPHIHFETDGITRDKNGNIRWSVHDCFQLKTKSALNEQVPLELKKEFNYDLEACDRHAPGTRKQLNLSKTDYVREKAAKIEQQINQSQQELIRLNQEIDELKLSRDALRSKPESFWVQLWDFLKEILEQAFGPLSQETTSQLADAYKEKIDEIRQDR